MLPKLPPGDDDPIGDLPVELLEDPNGNYLLALEAEGDYGSW